MTTTRIINNAGSSLTRPDGTPLAFVQVSFMLATMTGIPCDVFDAVTGERVVGSVSVVTDANGLFSASIWPNDRGSIASQYVCTINYPGAGSFSAGVPSGALPLTWLQFKTSGLPVTPQIVTALTAYIAQMDADVAAASVSVASAAGSATSAAVSASTATAQAGIATTGATAATTQAGIAASQATSASGSATSASGSASTATTQASNSAGSATSAANSATTATAQAVIATTGATTATTQAGIATTGAATATAQAGIATAQSTAASSSAASALAIYGNTTAMNTAVSTTTTNASTATAQAVIATTQATAAAASAASAVAIVTGVASARPSIRPSLLLDFANAGTLDPRVTFTRASTANYYDGKTVAIAEQNLLLQSQTFGTTWVTTNGALATGITDPATTLTATTLTATAANATVYQTLNLFALPYTFSIYMQRVAGTGTVNLTLDGTTLTPETITMSWVKYSITATPTAASNTIGVQIVTLGDAVNIWGAQLEQRSSVTAYNATTTVAITNYIPVLLSAPVNTPRFDHDPIAGTSLGLLIEQQSTNLFTYSSTFNNTSVWSTYRGIINQSVAIAPDGTVSASKLIADTSTTPVIHSIIQTITTTAQSYTLTVYAKQGEYSYLIFRGIGAADNYFNLSNGTLGSISTGVVANIISVGNGWYRCSATAVFLAQASALNIAVSNNGSNTFTGDGYSGIYIWGAQLEALPLSTSYIPTVASQVTRSADTAQMIGTNFSSWHNQMQGSFYVNCTPQTVAQSGAVFVVNTTSYHNEISIFKVSNLVSVSNGTQWGYAVTVNDIGYSSALSAVNTANVNSSLACSYIGGSGVFAVAGAIISTIIIPAQMPQPILLRIGSRDDGYFINGTIKRIAYYPQALTNIQLQALTS